MMIKNYSHGSVRIAAARVKRARRRAIRMPKIAILGFGREGKSVLKFLQRRRLTQINTRIDADKKPEIWILDKNKNLNLTTSQAVDIKFQTGKNYLQNLDKFDIVFRSPGVPYNLPEAQKAVEKGVEISSATALFFDIMRRPIQMTRRLIQKKSPRPIIIGVTGTKGKGTTATLLCKILKNAWPERSQRVYLAGNMGKPTLNIIPRLSALSPRKSAIIILELSSFQLQDLNQSPNIAVVLDIFPDHLDSHKNFKEYLNAKANIAKWQKKSDKIFYFSDNKYSKWLASKSRAKKIPVKSSILGRSDLQKLKEIIQIPGKHNLKNAVMAATVASSLGCQKDKILKVVKNFRGNEHRLELVRKIMVRQAHHKNKSQIYFYNDSASTNPQTAAAAIKAFKEPKILIAGGKDKGLNYSSLARALKNSNTKLAILFGENKNKIAKAILRIKNKELRIMKVKNLKQAVQVAHKTAKFLIHNSYFIIHIIFSPASASFDMFKDYEERGREFKKIVKSLPLARQLLSELTRDS